MKHVRATALAFALGGLILASAPASAQRHGGSHGGHGASMGHARSGGHHGSVGNHGSFRNHGFVQHRGTFRHGRRHHGRGTSFGFVGFGFGSPFGSPYYYNGGYPYDYYDDYPYRSRYYSRRRCRTEWVWDDYEGEEVPVRVCRRR